MKSSTTAGERILQGGGGGQSDVFEPFQLTVLKGRGL